MRPCEEEQEEEEEIRICHTRDIHLDHPAVQQKMEEIWNTAYSTDDSDPTAQSERRESLWAIEWKVGNDYRFIEAIGGTITSCSMRGASVGLSRDIDGNPKYLVGFLHVEPFAPGEVITDQACLEARDGGGNYSVAYGSDLSRNDAKLSKNYNVPVYVMNKNKISVIEPLNETTYSITYSRCGY